MIPPDAVPFWLLGIAIFALRIVDVSIGTVRTIFMVQGHQRWAVLLGFFEVLVWLLAVSQVVTRINESPWLAPFFAGGFSAGIWVGMAIERWLALGRYVIRLISRSRSREIVEGLSGNGHVLATFVGETADGPVSLVFVSARGSRVRSVLDVARSIDPDVFVLVEAAMEWSENVYPLPHATGWRAVFKKK
jgi:uncharacterized protein YebE (UPF0316 family)